MLDKARMGRGWWDVPAHKWMTNRWNWQLLKNWSIVVVFSLSWLLRFPICKALTWFLNERSSCYCCCCCSSALIYSRSLINRRFNAAPFTLDICINIYLYVYKHMYIGLSIVNWGRAYGAQVIANNQHLTEVVKLSLIHINTQSTLLCIYVYTYIVMSISTYP